MMEVLKSIDRYKPRQTSANMGFGVMAALRIYPQRYNLARDMSI